MIFNTFEFFFLHSSLFPTLIAEFIFFISQFSLFRDINVFCILFLEIQYIQFICSCESFSPSCLGTFTSLSEGIDDCHNTQEWDYTARWFCPSKEDDDTPATLEKIYKYPWEQVIVSNQFPLIQGTSGLLSLCWQAFLQFMLVFMVI